MNKFDYFMGFATGAALAIIAAMWFSIRDHKWMCGMLDKHNDWLRERTDRRDEGEWWKRGGAPWPEDQ